MKWVKRGLVFEPPADLGWMATHAALPVVDPMDGFHRVYFSGRDAESRARIGSFDVEIGDTMRVLRVSESPWIDLGPPGCYDDSGVTTSWIVNHEGRKYFYFTGWSRGVSVPFYLFTGLAISDDGGETFCKTGMTPLLDRNETDPFLTASPCVLVENGLWRMWYVSGSDWRVEDGAAKHYYHIRYAESDDGVRWRRDGTVCIDYAGDSEHAFARPSVLAENGRYRMWYPFRGAAYRIGYAESDDGIRWERRDAEAGIPVSEEGWDSHMVAYPHVFRHAGRLHMLYNGDGYGATGIGWAVLETEAGSADN